MSIGKIQGTPQPFRHRPVPFVAVRESVKKGSEIVCRAKSHTYARRIANALNRYTPGEKGY